MKLSSDKLKNISKTLKRLRKHMPHGHYKILADKDNIDLEELRQVAHGRRNDPDILAKFVAYVKEINHEQVEFLNQLEIETD